MVGMKIFIGCALVVCALAAACGGDSPTATPSSAPQPTATAALGSPPVPTPRFTPTSGAPAPGTVEGTPGQDDVRPVAIEMVSPTAEVRPGQELRVELTVNPQGRGISGVELEVRFDPAILQIREVVPGDLLGEKPEEVSSTIPVIGIDNVSGTLHYVDVRTDVTLPPTPPGLLATMVFRVPPTAPEGREGSIEIVSVKIPDERFDEIRDVAVGREVTVAISR